MFLCSLRNNYHNIYEYIKEPSMVGKLSKFLVEGKQIVFELARKMMSWAMSHIERGCQI